MIRSKPSENERDRIKRISKKHGKKRENNWRILNLEQRSFTPLAFLITGGMDREFSVFINTLSANPRNGQTHSNRLFECIWPFYGVDA